MILKPFQPRGGFTVSSTTPEEEVEVLCRAWEESDAEGRHLIRLCAELSVHDDSDNRLRAGFIR